MASLLRSMMVIAAIAMQSPVHDKPAADARPAVASAPAAPRPKAEPPALGTAAREALEILAGLDPETRSRLLQLAETTARGAAAGHAAPAR